MRRENQKHCLIELQLFTIRYFGDESAGTRLRLREVLHTFSLLLLRPLLGYTIGQNPSYIVTSRYVQLNYLSDTFREQHFGCMYTKTIHLGPHSLQLTFLQMRSLRVAPLSVCVRKHFTRYKASILEYQVLMTLAINSTDSVVCSIL